MSDEERQATKRARYLERTTDLRRRVCKALAYSELGYSTGGIAKKIDANEGTVANYLERVVAHLGPAAVYPRAEEERGDLNRVTAAEVLEWPDHYREVYAEAASEHPDVASSGTRRKAEGHL